MGKGISHGRFSETLARARILILREIDWSIAPACSCTHDSSRDPNYGSQGDRPWREKCQGYANHSQAPRQRCCALSERISQRGDETGLGRNDVALAVNLDRHVSRGVSFVELCAGTILPLRYRFAPGHPLDGLTLTVPLALLNQLDASRLTWLVPGMIREKVLLLLKALPKASRNSFSSLRIRMAVPIANTTTAISNPIQ